MELYVATFNSPGENRKQEWNNLNLNFDIKKRLQRAF